MFVAKTHKPLPVVPSQLRRCVHIRLMRVMHICIFCQWPTTTFLLMPIRHRQNKLAVAMSALVKVHKVHIISPWNIAVVLGVQVQQAAS